MELTLPASTSAKAPNEVPDQGLVLIEEALAVRDAMGLHPRNKVELAAALSISKQALSIWRRVPPARVLAVEQLLDIPRTVLRPDIFGPHKGRYRYRVRVGAGRTHGGRHS
jgi:hypothetical protein